MITIEFDTFWSDQEDLKNNIIGIVEKTIGKATETRVIKDDDADLDSTYSIQLDYDKFDIDNFSYYNELKQIAISNELYVTVSDDFSNYRKGFWYDENIDWTTQCL